MQTTVSALILITSALILTCVVVDYAANVVQVTMQTSTIQSSGIINIEKALNQTISNLNQQSTIPLTNQTEPP